MPVSKYAGSGSWTHARGALSAAKSLKRINPELTTL